VRKPAGKVQGCRSEAGLDTTGHVKHGSDTYQGDMGLASGRYMALWNGWIGWMGGLCLAFLVAMFASAYF